MYCWKCSARVGRRARSCRRCGAALDQSPLLRARLRAPFYRRRIGAAVFAGLVLAGVLVAGFLLLRPPNLTTVPVPDVIGLGPKEAQEAVMLAGLTPLIKTSESSNQTLWDRVVQQTPPPGMRASPGERVVLRVYLREGGSLPSSLTDAGDAASTGQDKAYLPDVSDDSGAASPPPAPARGTPRPAPPREFGVPNVVGLTLDSARTQLRAAGLSLRVVRRASSPSVPAGSIIRQEPAAGANAPADDTVRVVVSSGKRRRLPSVVGRRERTALQTLRAAGFAARVARRWSPKETGVVLSASARPGALLDPGTVVNLIVSKGPPPAPARKPAPTTGVVTISASPAECPVWVYIDGGHLAGRSPCRLKIAAGDHTVTLWDTAHHVDDRFPITVQPGKVLTISRRLH